MLLLTALLLAGCASSPATPDEGAQEFLGYHAANVLAAPTRIEGWYHKSTGGTRYPDRPDRQLDIAVAHELRGILFSEDTYRTLGKGGASTTLFAFRVWRDSESVDVLVSLASDDVTIKTRGPSGQPTSISAGITASHDRMVKLAKRAFPDFKE
jgi:hypothetical protein